MEDSATLKSQAFTGLPALNPQGTVLTAVRGHLPLLIDQQQDKGEAEDSHNAGARGQGRSRDACKDKSS